MRVVVELYREDNGRLEGVLELPDGHQDVFVSTLDLLRVLEGLDLSRRADPAAAAGPTDERSGPGADRGGR